MKCCKADEFLLQRTCTSVHLPDTLVSNCYHFCVIQSSSFTEGFD